MTRFIFILSLLLVYFLTIESNPAINSKQTNLIFNAKIETFSGNDTIATVFSDNFEIYSLSGWEQTTDWEVSAVDKISGTLSLKHAPKASSGTSFLFHPVNSNLNVFDLAWTFKLKNGNWDPSSSNRFWFYLTADTTQTELINGYAVGVNISGSTDLLELWRIRKGKADSLIVESDLDWNAATLATIWTKRSVRGVWTVQYQKPDEAKSRIFTGTDPAIPVFKKLGICFNYTSTRAGQLWVDDVSAVKLQSELFIQKLALMNASAIRLTFNKPVDMASALPANFKLCDENGNNIRIIQVVRPKDSDQLIDVYFEKTSGTELSLYISGVADLSGKSMLPDTRTFSYTFQPEPGSVLINEILFNPFTGGSDFVELVNVSNVSIPVHRMMLATRNDTLALKQIYPLSAEKRYLKPGEFLVCSKDPDVVAAQYMTCNPAAFCPMKSFPSFPDDAGTVVLLNDSLVVMDEFSYSYKMHSAFLADEEGVSLERISLGKPTGDPTNWQSAAESVGFATPGLPNSQSASQAEVKNEITCEPKAFSPNGDGYNDELTIRFQFEKPGYIANVRIFDAVGREVRHLIKNQSLAQEGIWNWDGKSESGQKLNIGAYILLVEVFDRDGHSKAFKKTCTLTGRI